MRKLFKYLPISAAENSEQGQDANQQTGSFDAQGIQETLLDTTPQQQNSLSLGMKVLYFTAAVLSLLGAVQQLFAAVRFGLALQLPEQMDGVKDGDINIWWPILYNCLNGSCALPLAMGFTSYIANVILGVMFFPNTIINMYKSIKVTGILLRHTLPRALFNLEPEQLPSNLLDYTPSVSYPFPKHYEHLKPPTIAFIVFDLLSLCTSWTTAVIYLALGLEAITDLTKVMGAAAYIFLGATVFVNYCSRYVGSRNMFRKFFNSIPFWPDAITNTMRIWPRTPMEKNALQNLSYLAKHIRRNQFELTKHERAEIARYDEPADAIRRFLELTNEHHKPIDFSYTQQEFLEEIGPSLVACMSMIVFYNIAQEGIDGINNLIKDIKVPSDEILKAYIALPNFLYYLMMFPQTALAAYTGYAVLQNKAGSVCAKLAMFFIPVFALLAGGNMADKFLEFVADGHANWLNPEHSDAASYALYGAITVSGLLCSAFPNFIAFITATEYFYDPQQGDFEELLNDIETELTKGVADSNFDGYTEYAAIVGMWREDNDRAASISSDGYDSDTEHPARPLILNMRQIP
jgi:hypothetical protein